MTILSFTILIIAIVGLILLVKRQYKNINENKESIESLKKIIDSYQLKYAPIIEIEKETIRRQVELQAIEESIDQRNNEFKNQNIKLNLQYTEKRNLFQELLSELAIVEENLNDISYGLYKPHFDYSSSEEYKLNLTNLWVEQKEMVKSGIATHSPTEWTVNGSKTEGRKMTNHHIKLMLRAFNGECDASIARVSWNNIGTMEARVMKALDAINKLGAVNKISITRTYLNLKLKELYLEFELQEKIHAEKEEQKKIREQMREEEKAQRELEKARQDAEQEEKLYQKALDKANAEIEKTYGADKDILNQKIFALEENLKKAQEQKARAISRAQQTKSGHVYIISNIGSFGDEVFKFGMTRRLDPQDRIDELGNASVPFNFDVHGLIYSENAPELENKLHKHFHQKRINLVHLRREFFKVSIDEIEKAAHELGLTLELTKIAEAREFRMSASMREAQEKELMSANTVKNESTIDKFPIDLLS